MIRPSVILAAAALSATLTACSSPPRHEGWSAKKEAGGAAYDECRDEIDTTMRLRGYPIHPLPETPQFEYRKTIFAQCMRRKGYEPE
jgi:hypothetical protein